MDKIKVLIVIRHPVGGIRTYLKYTYCYLDSAKYHLTLLTVKNEEGALINEDLKHFDLDFIAVEERLFLPRTVLKIFKLLWRDHFDFIHSQGYTAGVISVLGNMFRRIPHLITSHDVFRQDQFPWLWGNVKRRLLSFFLGQVDFIQSVSEDAQQNLVDFLPGLGRKKGNLVVILNGIAVSHLEENENETSVSSIREQFDLGNSSFLFGFLGRFMPQKGFEYLIEAVERISREMNIPHKFCIVAANEGAFIREYKNMVEAKDLSRYFRFIGFMPNVGKILRELDALVIPSLWEAYGLIAAEAFVVGCPVIASDCIGLREVIHNTPARVVRQRDSVSLAVALREFMDSPEIFKKRAKEFVPEARSRFDSRKTAAQLDTLFEKVVASPKTG
ncbi:MAG: glycosyltransferase family 4 protein [Pseudomonadota bacterium]